MKRGLCRAHGSGRPLDCAAGSAVFVAGNDQFVRALDASTGAEKWAVDCGVALACSPVIDSGKLWVATLMGDLIRIEHDPAATEKE